MMTKNEACDIAGRIMEVFQGPPMHVWEEVLMDLDPGVAGTAYKRLTREHQHRWLSIADFLTAYRSLDTRRPEPGPACGDCDGTGWVQAGDHVENAGTDHERRYTTVRPCTRCPAGKQAERSSVWRERTTDQNKEHAA